MSEQTPEPRGYQPPPQPTGGYAAPRQHGPSGPRAGFWARLGALILDYILLWIIPAIVLGVGVATSNLTTYRTSYGTTYSTGSLSPLVWIGYVLAFVLPIVYFIYFEGSASGQTLGKRAVGIRVIDARTGGPIGYGRSFIRLIGRWISGIVCYLGYLWMLWDDEKQTWHDKMATAYVVPVSAYPVRR